MKPITPHEVHLAWRTGREIAVIDLREEARHALAHPLFASCLPLSRLEVGLYDLLPRRDVTIALFDEGEGLVEPAAQRLQGWGYTDVRALAGGLQGWREAGLELFEDVNSPSKAFGELVEHYRGTPYVTATDLNARIERGDDLVVLDARRFDEYATMSIPGSVSVPGAELVLRAPALAPSPETTVVVNCAGRTRSIIGAQSLINAGLPNPVAALRNGTIGWTLDGLELQTGQGRRYPEVGSDADRAAREKAREVSYRAGVRMLSGEELAALEDDGRTTYRIDVRPADEFAAGHPAGFRNVAGGQLVQETDMVAPVRGARIVLYDDRGVRAHMSASWLAQMNWDCYVVEEVSATMLVTGEEEPNGPPPLEVAAISPAELQALDPASVLIVDLSPSNRHRKGHVPGARFAMRGRLDSDLAPVLDQRRVVLVSADGLLARHAAPWFAARGAKVAVLDGGTAGWTRAGLPLETGMDQPLSPADDVYRRPYEGLDNPREKMQAYLEWEYGLVAQLFRDGSHGFTVV